MILCSGVDFTAVKAEKVLDPCDEMRWFEVRSRGGLEVARVESVTPWGKRLVKVTLEDGRYFNVFRDHAVFIRGRL